MSRQLDEEEIDGILSVFDDLYLGLDKFTRSVLLDKLKQPLRVQLKQVQIQPHMIYKLRRELSRIYRPIEPGRPVGIITAQSIGEMQTQMNLNVFHRAGHRDQQVEQSSRLQELISATKTETQGSLMCSVYYLDGFEKEHMLRQIVFKTFKSYVLDFHKQINPKPWESAFENFFGATPAKKMRYLYQLDLEVLFRYRIDLATISNILTEKLETPITFSPLHLGEICIHMDSAAIHESALCVVMHGIPLIKNAYFLPKAAISTETFIETEGSNLKEILYLPFVDSFNTTTNDIWEISSLFGIEATRQFLIEEFEAIMPAVHFSHLEFMADRMTVTGQLRSITRYTRKTESRASVLSKITFEETVKRATEAAFKEHADNMKGCSASVIVGKLPSTGAGMNDLYFEYE